MRDWDWTDWTFWLGCGAVVMVVIWVIAAVIYDSMQPTFTLSKAEWKCTQQSTRTLLQPMMIGKTTVLMPMVSTVCDRYERR